MNVRHDEARLPPVPPGEILLEEFMKPLGLSQSRLARDLDIPQSRLSAIIRGKRGLTADTSLRLAEYFGVTPRFWLNLQAEYDLRRMEQGGWPRIRARIRPLAAQ